LSLTLVLVLEPIFNDFFDEDAGCPLVFGDEVGGIFLNIAETFRATEKVRP
jgi:hypothetical protein